MLIEPDFSLKNYNTLGLNIRAKNCIRVNYHKDLSDLFNEKWFTKKFLVIGEASNILFKSDYDGLIIMMNTRGIEVAEESKDEIILNVQAGENWNELVNYTVKNNYWGIENLSMIPGKAGAAPIKNIGAYGTELKDVFVELKAFDTTSGEIKTFTKEECKFAYRDSIFKSVFKGRYIVLNIRIKLSKIPNPNITYKALHDYLGNVDVNTLKIGEIQDAINSIRSSKLPDPEEISNCGSFFKNPVVSSDIAEDLKSHYSDMPVYKVDAHNTKLAAGWLIEKSGWKGKRKDDAGVHEKQALVLVNYGNASGHDIYNLSVEIARDVYKKFGIQLEREVRVI
ncbi:MAG: UDP-N-acetylenolpyruvoylglucosamine reductase [Marinilabiliales bacterium]|nr:MAG: UDP-N-acetylenolpyruvoylglucosamine reductase [Marinilabiliales bacterium]